jgi:hypothetical protein
MPAQQSRGAALDGAPAATASTSRPSVPLAALVLLALVLAFGIS